MSAASDNCKRRVLFSSSHDPSMFNENVAKTNVHQKLLKVKRFGEAH
jgi:hypothetical protein